MAERNFPVSALYVGDNLPFMQGMNSGTVDLIATDPPFNKGVKAFRAKDGTAADGQSFEDKWEWDRGDEERGVKGEHDSWLDAIVDYDADMGAAVRAVVEAAKLAQGYDTAAYLCWLGVRLIECHRILADAGSIYVHCDHTAGAWIKALLDSIFGRENFRNEIAWCYTGPGSPGMRQFNRKHDTLFWYAKGATWTFNGDTVRIPYKDPKQGLRRAMDGGEGIDKEQARIYRERGKLPFDWWDGFAIVARHKSIESGGERTGWATQKPLALYERIILASSNPGDLVFDPFAGCSTTLVAAEKHGRQWLGCDRDPIASTVVRRRLSDSRQLANPVDVAMLYSAPTRADNLPVVPDLVLKAQRPREKALPREELLKQLILRDGLRCQGCGLHSQDPALPDWKLRGLMHIDHKTPRSEGGSNAIDNRVLLCADCNLTKSDSLTLTGLRKHNQKHGRVIARVG